MKGVQLPMTNATIDAKELENFYGTYKINQQTFMKLKQNRELSGF